MNYLSFHKSSSNFCALASVYTATRRSIAPTSFALRLVMTLPRKMNSLLGAAHFGMHVKFSPRPSRAWRTRVRQESFFILTVGREVGSRYVSDGSGKMSTESVSQVSAGSSPVRRIFWTVPSSRFRSSLTIDMDVQSRTEDVSCRGRRSPCPSPR